MLKITVGLLSLSVAAAPAVSQCKVASGTHEGELLAFHTVPMVFSLSALSTPLPAGSVRIGLEGDYLPRPSAQLQETSLCYVRKQENTSLTDVFSRPRLTVSLPGGLAVEVSYVPEVHIGQARATTAGVAISYDAPLARLPGLDRADVIVRGHWATGTVHGPITCSKSALQQTSSTSPCYATQPSDDTFHPDASGIELVVGGTPPVRMFGVYAGIGVDRIDSRFQVGFRDASGHLDSTRVQLASPLIAGALLAGARVQPASRFEAGLQVYSVPGHSTTVRIEGGLRWPRLLSGF